MLRRRVLDCGSRRGWKGTGSGSDPTPASTLAGTLFPISGADLRPQISQQTTQQSACSLQDKKISGQLAWQAITVSRVSPCRHVAVLMPLQVAWAYFFSSWLPFELLGLGTAFLPKVRGSTKPVEGSGASTKDPEIPLPSVLLSGRTWITLAPSRSRLRYSLFRPRDRYQRLFPTP